MELTVISGKGGTGKTSILAALAQLAEESGKQKLVLVDADVDAPNLFLMVPGTVIHRESFSGEQQAHVDPGKCIRCGRCSSACRFDAIRMGAVNPWLCEGCGACTMVCPTHAIQLQPEETATIEVLQHGELLLIRAQMRVGGEGSGKLIARLRQVAKEYAPADALTLIDGSPGIGCSVISSLTGADLALIVTEPTQSGLHDLKRAVELCQHFAIPAHVCINQYDLNEQLTAAITDYCREQQLPISGRIPFDPAVREAQQRLEAVTKENKGPASAAIHKLWNQLPMQIEHSI